ncbi:MAG: 6,7-dimethyl-8-ribityllumazine synthase [Chitinophagaceae bacterium]|uniref:6,7-dimethyl-8-ribityllumazine synthase n=1 Tax=Rurimicrobium arvi TaxID=2049916 RepID=A0ABP8N041_9BACT
MALSSESSTLLSLEQVAQMKEAKVAIVYTEWNDAIIREQLAGCHRILKQAHAICVGEYCVPGAFEIPFACRQVYETKAGREECPEAIIAFGAVIRGGTPHFEYVCKAVTEGITLLNTSLNIPVIFGVLTLDTEQQAWERLGGIHGHKGEEAAIAALKMIHFNRSL